MLAHFTQDEFLQQKWDYQRGQQVFICAPTQAGKTRWGYKLLAATEHQNPPVVCVLKPIDPTPEECNRIHGFTETPTWPPKRRHFWQEPVRGYALWPRHSLSLDPASLERTDAHLKRQFETCLMDTYKNGDRVVFVDEVYGLLSELKMHKTILALVNRGSGAGAGLWYATQRPAGTQQGGGLPGPLFNSPSHYFLGRDSVEANRKIFSQISGLDSRMVENELANLRTHPIQTPHGVKAVSEWLYLCKDNGSACVITPW